MAAATAERIDSETQLVAFYLDRETYGIDIAAIQEIIRGQDITALPRAAQGILGVINLRGKVVPVVSLRSRLGMPEVERTSATRIIVVEVTGGTIGLVVDGVTGVLRIQQSSIEPPSELVSSVQENHLRGVGKVGDTLVIVLDIENVLRRDEWIA